jgi:hypothetical protein
MSKLLGGHSVTVSPVSYHYHIKQQRVLGWLAQCSGSGNWCRPLSESCHRHGGLFGRHLYLGLRFRLRDGAGNLSQACRTSSSDHGNLSRHARAARQSQLTIPWCPTRALLSEELQRARHAWRLPRGPYYKGVTR